MANRCDVTRGLIYPSDHSGRCGIFVPVHADYDEAMDSYQECKVSR